MELTDPSKLRTLLGDTFTYRDVLDEGVQGQWLYQLRDLREIIALGGGVYRWAAAPPADHDLIEITERYPEATICLESALARHYLTSPVPAVIDIALPRGGTKPKLRAPVHMHQFDPQTFPVGRETFPTGSRKPANIYSAERTIIDLTRIRRYAGTDLAREALRHWLEQPGNSPGQLIELARRLPRAETALLRALENLQHAAMPKEENVPMPDEPESISIDALADLIAEVDKQDDSASAYILRRAISQGPQQTIVGGRWVTRQDLPPLPASAATTVHRAKVTLHGSKPPIWRRLELPGAMTLDTLHHVLQHVFGWHDLHLHQFETVYGGFTDPDRDEWSKAEDEATVTLAQVAPAEKAKVIYMYDFGDDWRHDIVVEGIHPAEPGVTYPRCTAGRRADTPAENSGGISEHNENSNPEPFDPVALTDGISPHSKVLIPVDS